MELDNHLSSVDCILDNGFVMYGLHIKLVCLFVQVSVFVKARR